MRKRILIVLFFLALCGTFGIIGLIGSITWDQYQETRKWQELSLEGELKDVPPFLAKNYIRAEDREAVEAWDQVKTALTEIEEAGGISEGDVSHYEEIWKTASEKEKAYGLTSGDIIKQNERLWVYLDLEMVLKDAYEKPETEQIKSVTDRLYGIHIEKASPLDDIYFEKLSQIAADYKNLSAFLSETMPNLGTIADGALIVRTDVGPKVTENVRKEIEEKDLTKFPFVKDLYDRLDGQEWASLLRKTETVRAYQKWKAAEAKLESVQKSQYYAAATIVTYAQALEAGLEVRVTEKDGYTIDLNSPVESISYQGTAVSETQYIRYGTPVVVTIKEVYKEIPKPEVVEPTEEETSSKEEEKPDEEKPEDKPEELSEEDDDWDEDW